MVRQRGRAQLVSPYNPTRKGQFTGRITRDEWVFVGLLLPYLAMMLGMVLMMLLSFATRLFIWVDSRVGDNEALSSTWIMTGVVFISALVLCPLAYVFFRQRKAVIIAEHATITVAIGHIWWLLSMWENFGEWMWGRLSLFSWFFGSIIIGLSWCLRRWAKGDGDDDTPDRDGPFKVIGLGDSYLRKPQIEGNVARVTMQLSPGVTAEDVKKARTKLAGMAGVPRARLHVQDVPSGREDQVNVVLLRHDPFANPKELVWAGPVSPGESIEFPIDYGTYEDTERAIIYAAGKDGDSSEHFLVMGMSGCGKSKCWQCLYGSILCRRYVNLIFIDPAKGIQTAGPLLHGIDWFVDDYQRGVAALERVKYAIRKRTDYLASKGLSHWVAGCGINFLIVHVEEAARFANVKSLIELVEAARSAGIMFVLSLQRASGTRLKTDTRYNLGASMCFGTYGLRDAEFALSEYTRQSGAIPHHWQNRFPGRHYLETSGIDARKFAMSVQTDWLDVAFLKQVVIGGQQWRTPMDEVTVEALGQPYAAYRHDVSNGDTQWQTLEANGGLWSVEEPTIEIPRIVVTPDDIEPPQANQEATSNVSTADAERFLLEWLNLQAEKGIEEFQFKTVAEECSATVGRSVAWINQRLQRWSKNGTLPPQPRYGWYATPRTTR